MKINSNFKDYYDMYAYLGIDPSIVYNRATGTLDNEYLKSYRSTIIHPPYNALYVPNAASVERVFIGFCGKLYSMYLVRKNITNITLRDVPAIMMYSLDEAIEFASEGGFKFYLPNFVLAKLDRRLSIDIGNDIFRTIGSPVFTNIGIDSRGFHRVTPDTYIIVNPLLKDINFHKIVTDEQVWMELNSFIGGVLNVNETVSTMDDASKVSSHGFDSMSFRRDVHPSKPRRNKK